MKSSVSLAVKVSLSVILLISIVQYLIGYRLEGIAIRFISCLFPILLLASISDYFKKELNNSTITSITLAISLYLFGASLFVSEYNLYGAINSCWHQLLALFIFVLILNVSANTSAHEMFTKVCGNIKKIIFS